MFCPSCIDAAQGRISKQITDLPPVYGAMRPKEEDIPGRRGSDTPMSQRYPKYYKPIPEGMKELDFYAVAHIFGINDAVLSHALKKILLPGVRTGGKSRRDDIKEARDTLTRWLELHK